VNITDGVVVMTFLDRRPVQLLKTVIRVQQYDEGIHLLLEAQQAALLCTYSKTLMEDAKQGRHTLAQGR